MAYSGPLALLDLDRIGDADQPITLPPCPVIAVGDPHHPLAPQLDALAENGPQLAAIERQVLANPRAASVIAQLLRLLPSLDAEQGLVCESLALGLLQGSAEHARWLERQPAAPSHRTRGNLEIVRTGSRLYLALDNAPAGNTIDRTLRDELHQAFELAALDPEITSIHLTARGRCFSLGADPAEFGTTRDPATAHGIRNLTLPAWPILRCADRLSVRVEGACIGAGLEMAAFARHISASPGAWFQLPELAMGILPGAGGCVALTRRIGRQHTALMVLSGKRFSARQALAWGLIDEISPDHRQSHIAR